MSDSQKSPETQQSKLLQTLKKADQHYRQGHRLRAVWNYRKVLRMEPGNVAGLVNLGLIYSTMKGKSHLALEMLNKALVLDPDNPTILFNLATLTAQCGSLNNAEQLLERVEKLKPDYPDLHYNKAHLLARAEKYDEAWNEVERELALHPGSFNALAMKEALKVRMQKEGN